MTSPVPVLTAVTDALWEAELVAALDNGDLGMAVVRRCVDLADLLATASTGTARAALLSADLRRLDRDALNRLRAAGLAVVGLAAPGDEDAERRLRQLGVGHVLPGDSGPDRISAAVLAAVAGTGARAESSRPADPADLRAALPELPDLGDLDLSALGEPAGRLIAVWGPTGAPGRSTVAIGVATELAVLDTSTLLVDADAYGGVVAQMLGLLDEAPGLAAAARLANAGSLDVPALAGLARALGPRLSVLTGIVRAERWTELRPAALESVFALARRIAAVTVVDTGFSLEQDEELAYDTTAPRRNGATLAALAAADTVLAVGSADPVGLQRLVRGLDELRATLPDVSPQVVVNRLRRSAVPGDSAREIRAALQRYAGLAPVAFVPLDVGGVDAAVAAGRSLAEAAPSSPARQALQQLAGVLSGQPARPPRRRLLRARR